MTNTVIDRVDFYTDMVFAYNEIMSPEEKTSMECTDTEYVDNSKTITYGWIVDVANLITDIRNQSKQETNYQKTFNIHSYKDLFVTILDYHFKGRLHITVGSDDDKVTLSSTH